MISWTDVHLYSGMMCASLLASQVSNDGHRRGIGTASQALALCSKGIIKLEAKM